MPFSDKHSCHRSSCHTPISMPLATAFYMLSFVLPLRRLAVWMHHQCLPTFISNRSQAGHCLFYTFLCCNPQFASLRYFLPHVVTNSHVVLSPCPCFHHAARHIIIAPHGYSSSTVLIFIIIPSCDAIYTQFVIYWAPCPCYFHTSPPLTCPYTCSSLSVLMSYIISVCNSELHATFVHSLHLPCP